MKDKILERGKAYEEYQVTMRRYFHQNPEVSGQEYNTSKVIKEELDKLGIPWVKCGMETGILATIKGDKPGKTILLRADIDALRVQETGESSFASKTPGVMHACGHDCHISMLLTAAHIINDLRSGLCGTVKLAFQPSEEEPGGANAMLSEGAMEGVSGCFAIHIWNDVESGFVSCEAGPRMASVDKFIIDVKGKGGNGAAPHQCIDAVVVSSAIINNLQTIVSRQVAPVKPVVVTVGTVKAGTNWNVVAENCHMEGTVRCFDMELWEEIPERVRQIVEDTAKVFGAKTEFRYVRYNMPTINEKQMSALVSHAAKKVMGEEAVVDMAPTMAGEDFSEFQMKAPGVLAFLGGRSEACGAIWPQHSGNYCVDEAALIKGAMLYAQVAFDFVGTDLAG